MPRRRRNADGSLVVPLSDKQKAALAKGRAALAAKVGEPVSKESAARGGEALSKEPGARDKGQRARRRVETVRVSKGTSSRTKAKAKRSRSSGSGDAPSPPARSSENEPPRKSRLERWFTET